MTRIAHLDLVGGIAGDMLLAALIDLGGDSARLQSLPLRLGFEDVTIRHDQLRRGGFRAAKITIDWDHAAHPHHRSLVDIQTILERAELSAAVRAKAVEVFQILAEAEASVHDETPAAVHFHEVGAVDAICDIVGCCEQLAVLDLRHLSASPLPMGRGSVEGAHGSMPLPAPAVAAMLEGVPIFDAGVRGETVTPTGMALVKGLVSRYGGLPAMRVERVGVGAGSKDFPGRANIVRIFCGTSSETPELSDEQLWVIECTLDDLDPRIVPQLIEGALAHGALDAFVTPVLMKKGRPGFVLSLLAPADAEAALCALVFRETPTLGLRKSAVARTRLDRRSEPLETPYGAVEIKVASAGGRIVRAAPEFDSCLALAQQQGRPVREVLLAAEAAWHNKRENEA